MKSDFIKYGFQLGQQYFNADNHYSLLHRFRSTRPEMFRKKGVLNNYTKFTGKHLCQSLILKKLQASTLLKRDSGTGVFL